MRKVLSAFIWAASKIIGKKNLESLVIYTAKSINADLHLHGLLQMGAATNVYLENGSELFFIKNILTKQLESSAQPILFDVGANIGNYSLALKENIPNASIYSFEPVKETFEQLEKNVGDKTKLYNIGFGNLPGKGLLYNTLNTTISEVATTHKEILQEVFNASNEIVAIEFEIDSIDNFCSTNDIKNIDFFKDRR